jgi:hypothetical protein
MAGIGDWTSWPKLRICAGKLLANPSMPHPGDEQLGLGSYRLFPVIRAVTWSGELHR